jgi:hypothetical protein
MFCRKSHCLTLSWYDVINRGLLAALRGNWHNCNRLVRMVNITTCITSQRYWSGRLNRSLARRGLICLQNDPISTSAGSARNDNDLLRLRGRGRGAVRRGRSKFVDSGHGSRNRALLIALVFWR